MQLTREHLVWAYRLFLDREPESEVVIKRQLQGLSSVKELRRQFVNSAEFRSQVEVIASSDKCNIVIKEIAEHLRLFVDLSDTHIGWNIVNDSYEPEEREFVVQALDDRATAIDVGANIGFFTMVMAKRVGAHGHVYAFEPLPRNTSLLTRSVSENNFDSRVTVSQAAVGDQPGQMELLSLILTNNWGGPYLRTGNLPVPPDHEVTMVPVVHLDGCALRRPIKLIKVDAEGAEMLVVQGAKGLLRDDRPTVLAEINRKQLAAVSACSPTDLIGEMSRLGYSCSPLVQRNLPSTLNTYESDEIINVVFSPK